MQIQKRTVKPDTSEDYIQKSSVPIEQKAHKCWRRFMNERGIHRAYIPTSHGILSICYDPNIFCIYTYRTCSKLFNTWLPNYSIVYSCTMFNISCKSTRTILE